jgi:hypothetical protein
VRQSRTCAPRAGNALIQASRNGRLEVVKLLVADVNTRVGAVTEGSDTVEVIKSNGNRTRVTRV